MGQADSRNDAQNCFSSNNHDRRRPRSVFALERHIHASAGATSAQQLPIFVAKDLGLFDKHGLDVDLLVITGGSTLLQALVGRSIHSANVAAMAPVRAIAFRRRSRNNRDVSQ